MSDQLTIKILTAAVATLTSRVEALEEGVREHLAEVHPDREAANDEIRAALMPEWRRMVDSWIAAGTIGEAEDPLAAVLWLLHRVSLLQRVDEQEVADALARIVARCERMVGGGWQADPSGWVATPDIHALLNGLTMDPREVAFPETNWRHLGNAAAAWLRDLTLDGAQ